MHWARVAPAISVASRWRRAGPVSFVSRGHGPWDRECFYVLCACAVRVCILSIFVASLHAVLFICMCMCMSAHLREGRIVRRNGRQQQRTARCSCHATPGPCPATPGPAPRGPMHARDDTCHTADPDPPAPGPTCHVHVRGETRRAATRGGGILYFQRFYVTTHDATPGRAQTMAQTETHL